MITASSERDQSPEHLTRKTASKLSWTLRGYSFAESYNRMSSHICWSITFLFFDSFPSLFLPFLILSILQSSPTHTQISVFSSDRSSYSDDGLLHIYISSWKWKLWLSLSLILGLHAMVDFLEFNISIEVYSYCFRPHAMVDFLVYASLVW